MMSRFIFQKPRIDSIPSLYKSYTSVDVLRLDLVHPVISGNKWYKLQGWLELAELEGKKSIVTWGGAWSNHIVATAAACQSLQLPSTGLIRGEEPEVWSQTLLDARELGMELIFLPRQEYKEKILPDIFKAAHFVIPEGGYGLPGLKGLQKLYDEFHLGKYTHILTATGTGTTLAALVAAAEYQQIIGIPVLKNYPAIQQEINRLLDREKQNRYELITGYEFGGYAKHPPALIQFMNEWYQNTSIPSDIVYTGKLFYAANSLLQQGYFPEGSRILLLHTGGLQGNASLSKGTLIF